MRGLIVLALCVISAHAAFLSQDEVARHWINFKRLHNKVYGHDAEHFRFTIFQKNVERIINHNLEADLGMHSYRLGLNKYADLTAAEFKKQLNGFRPELKTPAPAVHYSRPGDLPASVDWRDKGYVTPIKDQGQCGSCWAFSAVASLEGQHFNSSGKLVSLSEQNLVDCVTVDYGCGGGLMDDAFKYIISNKGIDTEKSYPYEAQDDTCRYNKKNIGSTAKSFVDIPTGDEKALQNAVATVGPISVAIDASQYSFQLYQSGVYDEPNCSSQVLDHGVTAVGYGTTKDGVDFWLVKNSWGTSWGEQGYIQMSRNKNNQCGIATASSYPVV